MRDTRPRLDEVQITYLFDQLRKTYGRAFEAQWSPAADMTLDEARAWVRDLKAHWAVELGAWHERPGALRWALEHLPDQPPSLIMFRSLCVRCPEVGGGIPDLPQANPVQDQTRISEIRRKLQGVAVLTGSKPIGSRDWAYKLKAREDRGEALTYTQRLNWRQALGVPDDVGRQRAVETVQQTPGVVT